MAIYIPPCLGSNGGGGGGGTSNFTNARVVFRENFTEAISSNTLQLSGNITNGTFTEGSWNVTHILTGLQADITDWSGNAIYDGSIIFFRNRIQVVSISNTGLVTLNYVPMPGQQIAVWYWYSLAITDVIDNYYREEHIASMEEIQPDFAGNVEVNTQNFIGNLNSSDTDVQKALNSFDAYSPANVDINSINGIQNAGGNIDIIGTNGIYIIADDVHNSITVGISGISGSGGTGTSGFSGYSGALGISGFSGYSGFSGASGISGFSGFSGFPTDDSNLVHKTFDESISGNKTFYNEIILPNVSYVTSSSGLGALVVDLTTGIVETTDLPIIRQGMSIVSPFTQQVTISHSNIDPTTDFPVVSLLLPSPSSPIFGYGVANRTNMSFDIILSMAIPISGYSLTWMLNSV
jgi:hypothetical protein